MTKKLIFLNDYVTKGKLSRKVTNTFPSLNLHSHINQCIFFLEFNLNKFNFRRILQFSLLFNDSSIWDRGISTDFVNLLQENSRENNLQQERSK